MGTVVEILVGSLVSMVVEMLVGVFMGTAEKNTIVNLEAELCSIKLYYHEV